MWHAMSHMSAGKSARSLGAGAAAAVAASLTAAMDRSVPGYAPAAIMPLAIYFAHDESEARVLMSRMHCERGAGGACVQRARAARCVRASECSHVNLHPRCVLVVLGLVLAGPVSVAQQLDRRA